jgi:hypothetical protein
MGGQERWFRGHMKSFMMSADTTHRKIWQANETIYLHRSLTFIPLCYLFPCHWMQHLAHEQAHAHASYLLNSLLPSPAPACSSSAGILHVIMWKEPTSLFLQCIARSSEESLILSSLNLITSPFPCIKGHCHCGPPVPSSAQSRNNPLAHICMHPSHPIPLHLISLTSAHLTSRHLANRSPRHHRSSKTPLQSHPLGSLTFYPCHSPLHQQSKANASDQNRKKLEKNPDKDLPCISSIPYTPYCSKQARRHGRYRKNEQCEFVDFGFAIASYVTCTKQLVSLE